MGGNLSQGSVFGSPNKEFQSVVPYNPNSPNGARRASTKKFPFFSMGGKKKKSSIGPDLEGADCAVSLPDWEGGMHSETRSAKSAPAGFTPFFVAPKPLSQAAQDSEPDNEPEHKDRGPLSPNTHSSLNLDFRLTEGQARRGMMADCEFECSQITDFMFVGGASIATSWEAISSCNITRVVNCSAAVVENCFISNPKVKYLSLNMVDGRQDDIGWFVFQVIQFIEEGRAAGEKTLVHCEKGISRSCSFAIAHRIWDSGSSWKDAFDFVKQKRRVCAPNTAFTCNLIEFADIVHGACKGKPLLFRCAYHLNHDMTTPVLKLCRDSFSRKSLEPFLSLLDSKGVFVLRPEVKKVAPSSQQNALVLPTKQKIYVWKGQQSSNEALQTALLLSASMGEVLLMDASIETVLEGQEPDEFLDMVVPDRKFDLSYDTSYEDLWTVEHEENLSSHQALHHEGFMSDAKLGSDLDTTALSTLAPTLRTDTLSEGSCMSAESPTADGVEGFSFADSDSPRDGVSFTMEQETKRIPGNFSAVSKVPMLTMPLLPKKLDLSDPPASGSSGTEVKITRRDQETSVADAGSATTVVPSFSTPVKPAAPKPAAAGGRASGASMRLNLSKVPALSLASATQPIEIPSWSTEVAALSNNVRREADDSAKPTSAHGPASASGITSTSGSHVTPANPTQLSLSTAPLNVDLSRVSSDSNRSTMGDDGIVLTARPQIVSVQEQQATAAAAATIATGAVSKSQAAAAAMPSLNLGIAGGLQARPGPPSPQSLRMGKSDSANSLKSSNSNPKLPLLIPSKTPVSTRAPTDLTLARNPTPVEDLMMLGSASGSGGRNYSATKIGLQSRSNSLTGDLSMRSATKLPEGAAEATSGSVAEQKPLLFQAVRDSSGAVCWEEMGLYDDGDLTESLLLFLWCPTGVSYVWVGRRFDWRPAHAPMDPLASRISSQRLQESEVRQWISNEMTDSLGKRFQTLGFKLAQFLSPYAVIIEKFGSESEDFWTAFSEGY